MNASELARLREAAKRILLGYLPSARADATRLAKAVLAESAERSEHERLARVLYNADPVNCGGTSWDYLVGAAKHRYLVMAASVMEKYNCRVKEAR